MPGESYGRRLGSLLLYLCYVFRAINSLVFIIFILYFVVVLLLLLFVSVCLFVCLFCSSKMKCKYKSTG